MEARLFPFVFNIYFVGTLMVEEHLPEDEFEVIFVHVIARARYLIISHIREIEGRAVTMTALRDGIDIAAALEEPDVFLRTQHTRYIESVMRQVIATEYIRPLHSDCIQFAFGGRYQIRHGMREAVHNIVLICLDFNETFAHGCGIISIFPAKIGRASCRERV